MAGVPILIVDDNPVNARLAILTLEAGGYEVRVACDAESALAAIAERPPRMVITDVQLPGMDGLALTRRLKADEATRSIVIVAVTAHAMAADEARAMEAGCDAYFAKPIDTRTIAEELSRLLRARGGS